MRETRQIRWGRWLALGLIPAWFGWAGAAPLAGAGSRDDSGNELSYGHYVESTQRFKCLYGYAADKTGDHAAARRIFEDCAQRFGDVYSMIWLAQMYESGSGVPQDDVQATAWIRQGALQQDAAGYGALARYHYGVALHQGKGVAQDLPAARQWLERAAAEGVRDAADYLRQHDLSAGR